MKKKIKDLTLEEVKKICHNQKKCFYCPFHIFLCDDDFQIECLEQAEDILNQEIEEEEDD